MVNKKQNNIDYVEESDYNITSQDIDIWVGDFPHNVGDKFPSDKLRERASISKTNRLLYYNEYSVWFTHLFDGFEEFDPLLLTRARRILEDMPFFKTITDSYVDLCCSTPPTIDSVDSVDIKVSNVLSNSNFYESIEYLFKSIFLDPFTAYVIKRNKRGEIKIQFIPVKNCIIYVDPDDITCTYCIEVFNIIEDKVEFIDYFNDGKIEKRTFKYKEGTLGEMIGDVESELAYGGKYPISPAGYIVHNPKMPGDIYGTDQFRFWDASIVQVCCVYEAIAKLVYKAKEVIRLTPESAIIKDNNSLYGGQGGSNVVYNDTAGKEFTPEVKYAIPEIKDNIEALLDILEKSIKSMAMSSGLSPLFFDHEKVGTNLSAKSLRVAILPTLIKAEKMCSVMTDSLKEIIQKIVLFEDVETNKSMIDVRWYSGVMEESERTEYITQRYKDGTMTLEDALVEIDKIPRRVAREKVNILLNNAQKTADTLGKGVLSSNTTFNDNSVDFNYKNNDSDKSGIDSQSNSVPDYQMPIIP